jgi:integrase/recombinase XerD
MKRRSRSHEQPLSLPGDPSDPHGLLALAAAFLETLSARGFSPQTVRGRRKYLAYFIEWAAQRGISRAAEVTKPILERYQRSMSQYRKSDGAPLSFRTQQLRLSALRVYFRWLSRQNFILYNPASELELPRKERRLPRQVLSPAEAEAVLAQPDITGPLGLRDRAILETLYSTALRRGELRALSIYDVDFELGTVLVRSGKGKADRVVPIGERALWWLNKYLLEARPALLCMDEEQALFVGELGKALSVERLSQLVHGYIEAAEIGKGGSCHVFRHSCATQMLENGADIRFIQQMLGHADITSTQVYTQVSIRQLKAIHAATHPAARLRRPEKKPTDE